MFECGFELVSTDLKVIGLTNWATVAVSLWNFKDTYIIHRRTFRAKQSMDRETG